MVQAATSCMLIALLPVVRDCLLDCLWIAYGMIDRRPLMKHKEHRYAKAKQQAMKQQESGQLIQLGDTWYCLGKQLGSGSMASVALAVMQGVPPPAHVIIKRARDAASLAEMQHEAEVLAVLNACEAQHIGIAWPTQAATRLRCAHETSHERAIIALLDAGEDAEGAPFLVQEYAPPMFQPFPVRSLADEARMLSVARRLIDALALVHSCGFALKDFNPQGMKGDRIRLARPYEKPFNLKLIDWNITGSAQEQAQDLFYLGGHLYTFLLGAGLPWRANQPPADLGAGVAGWEPLSQGSRHILQRLLSRNEHERYPTAAALGADVAWWLDMLHEAGLPDAAERLKHRARAESSAERRLAIEALLLHPDLAQTLPPLARQALAQQLEASQQAQARALPALFDKGCELLQLGESYYAAAATAFDEVLRRADLTPTERQGAQLYTYLAQAAVWLAQAGPLPAPQVAHLQAAAEALYQHRWQEAHSLLLQPGALPAEAHACEPLNHLRNLAQAGVLAAEAHRLLQQAAPETTAAPPALDVPNAPDLLDLAPLRRQMQAASTWLQRQRQAVHLLQQAHNLVPPPLREDFAAEHQAAQATLQAHEQQLQAAQEVEHLLSSAQSAWQQGLRCTLPPRVISQGDADQAFASEQRILQNYEAAVRAFEEAEVAFLSAREKLEHLPYTDLETLHEQLGCRAAEAATHAREAAQGRRNTEKSLAMLLDVGRCLDEGSYQEALHCAGEAVALAGWLREAREKQDIARAGLQLVAEARHMLQRACDEISTRRLAAARSTLEQLLQWRHQPFAAFPIGAGLAHEESQRLFLLPQDLYQPACTALHIIEHITCARQQVAELLAHEDYQQACSAMDHLEHLLGEAGYALHAEETALRQQARARLHALESAEHTLAEVRAATAAAPQPAPLAQASGTPEGAPARLLHLLITAWDTLGPEHTARAEALRHEMAAAWLSLARHSAHTHQHILHAAHARLQNLPVWERFAAEYLAPQRQDTPGKEQREQSVLESRFRESTGGLPE